MLILSSGYVYSFQEADVMRALAIDQGVPASAILLERRAAKVLERVPLRRWGEPEDVAGVVAFECRR